MIDLPLTTYLKQPPSYYEYGYLRTKTCDGFAIYSEFGEPENLYTAPKISKTPEFEQGYLRDYWELEGKLGI